MLRRYVLLSVILAVFSLPVYSQTDITDFDEFEVPSCEEMLAALKARAEEKGVSLEEFDEDEFLANCEAAKARFDDIEWGEHPGWGEGVEIEAPTCDEILASIVAKAEEKGGLPEDFDEAAFLERCEAAKERWEDIDFGNGSGWGDQPEDPVESCDDLIARLTEKAAELPVEKQPDLEKVELICRLFEADENDTIVDSDRFGEIQIPDCQEVKDVISAVTADKPEEEQPTNEDLDKVCEFLDDLEETVADDREPYIEGENICFPVPAILEDVVAEKEVDVSDGYVCVPMPEDHQIDDETLACINDGNRPRDCIGGGVPEFEKPSCEEITARLEDIAERISEDKRPSEEDFEKICQLPAEEVDVIEKSLQAIAENGSEIEVINEGETGSGTFSLLWGLALFGVAAGLRRRQK